MAGSSQFKILDGKASYFLGHLQYSLVVLIFPEKYWVKTCTETASTINIAGKRSVGRKKNALQTTEFSKM